VSFDWNRWYDKKENLIGDLILARVFIGRRQEPKKVVAEITGYDKLTGTIWITYPESGGRAETIEIKNIIRVEGESEQLLF